MNRPDPSRARQLWRGLTGRCPRCGSRGLFERWFWMRARCPRCDLDLVGDEGDWTGGLVMNFVLTGGAFTLVFIAMVAATAPHIPVETLLAVLVPITVVVPVLAYPISRTLWVAVERSFLHPR